MRKKRLLGCAVGALTLGLAVAVAAQAGFVLGPRKYSGPALPPSTLAVPHERTLAWKSDSPLANRVYESWAARPLGDFQKGGKGDLPRILLGRLLTKRQLAETNQHLLTLQPWGVSGTSGWQNPKGDYDFAESVLTTVLWKFGDDAATLFPAAREHLLNVLLTEGGGEFRTRAPRTLGLIEETENHILMTEGSRYLKNRWLRAHGNTSPRFDNDANGMEGKLLAFLAAMRAAGLHEFNSQPYVGYTLLGLLNLEAFASERLRAAARDVLDYMNGCYALGGYRLRHFPPFRRSPGYASMTALSAGYQTAYMTAWLSYAESPLALPELQRGGETHALIGACLPYRPPDAVVRLLFDKGAGYFVQLGHGLDASPEIFSAGPGFLLSAGGVVRGKYVPTSARAITLLVDNDADDLAKVFHLAGPGNDSTKWNNTGVHRHFACAAGPVQVPAGATAVRENGPWKLFAPTPGVRVAVYSTGELGLVAVFTGTAAGDLLDAIAHANPDASTLAHSFQFPGGAKLTYDVRSPKDKGVMISDDGRLLDRDFDRWPLLAGDLSDWTLPSP